MKHPSNTARGLWFASRPLTLFPLASFAWALAFQEARAILDTNRNGLSDIWEIHHYNGELFPESFDPQADPDSDGWTNAQEAVAGTNPFDPNPPDGQIHPCIALVPAVLAVADENGNSQEITQESFSLTWSTIPGKQYSLFWASNLEEESWQPLDNPFISFGTEAYFGISNLRTDGSKADQLFWRVAVNDVDSDGDGLVDKEEDDLGTDGVKSSTVNGLPDLWLATYFLPTLLNGGIRTIDPNADLDQDGRSTREEFLDGTNPNMADSPSDRHWISVTGNGAEGLTLTRTGTLTIPAGQSATLMVALASDEFPFWTGDLSEYNDFLEWTALPSQGSPIVGSIDVNKRHLDWDIDQENNITLPGFPSPTHFEEVRTLVAPDDEDLTIEVTVSATNISDDQLPSHIAVGVILSE